MDAKKFENKFARIINDTKDMGFRYTVRFICPACHGFLRSNRVDGCTNCGLFPERGFFYLYGTPQAGYYRRYPGWTGIFRRKVWVPFLLNEEREKLS